MPDGLIRKITDIEHTGNQLVIKTEYSTITDALISANLKGKINLDKANIKQIRIKGNDGKVKSYEAEKISGNGNLAFRVSYADSKNLNSSLQDKDGNAVSVGLTADYKMGAGISLYYEAEINPWLLRYYFSLSGEGSEDAYLKLTGSVYGSISAEGDIMELRLPPIPVATGVWIIPTVVVQIGIEATAGMTVTAEFNESGFVTTGYATSNYKSVTQPSTSGNFTASAEFDYSVDGGVEAYLAEKLFAKFWGRDFGPYLKFKEVVGVTASDNYVPAWWIDLGCQKWTPIYSCRNPSLIELFLISNRG